MRIPSCVWAQVHSGAGPDWIYSNASAPLLDVQEQLRGVEAKKSKGWRNSKTNLTGDGLARFVARKMACLGQLGPARHHISGIADSYCPKACSVGVHDQIGLRLFRVAQLFCMYWRDIEPKFAGPGNARKQLREP
jgi:hypothetical protein